ncbi:MAG: hypothetical protein Q8J99_00060 [Sulfuritalea sp.]|nr:hypothetical protein [Sulfuritalea sp.]
MIYFLVTNFGAHTFSEYIPDWAGELGPQLQVHTYESLLRWPPPVTASYIFSDLERLTHAQLEIVRDFADHLEKTLPGARILNHPQHALRRIDLLAQLHAAGINRFRAHPLTRLPADLRFPVFLRFARRHDGPCTPLLADRQALVLAAAQLALAGNRLDEILAVEFCDTRHADGWFRKYSAFRIGDRVIAAHLIFSDVWVAKDGEPLTAALRAEEMSFIESNPHEGELRRIFDLARIQYGRIDYSLLGDRPQVWEINTNPILLKTRATYEAEAPQAIPLKEALAKTLRSSLAAINTAASAAAHPGDQQIRMDKFLRVLNLE